MQVDRKEQADFRARAKFARVGGKYHVKGRGLNRKMKRGQYAVESASKNQDKCPRHYAKKKAANRGRR